VTAWRRAACLAFAAVSAPFQFMPVVLAALRKAAERREVDAAYAALVAMGAISPMALRDLRAVPESGGA
jgi:hypothetical protein